MKNLIILGISRAGKTTLQKMILEQYKFNIVSIDAMISAFSKIIPDLGIHHLHNKRKPDTAIILIPFAAEYAIKLQKHTPKDIPILFEGASCAPEMALELFPSDTFKIIALGYPDINADECLKAIRENDTLDSWTKNFSDSELFIRCERNINESNILSKKCKELGIPFLNTSFNRDCVLKGFIDNLPEFLSDK